VNGLAILRQRENEGLEADDPAIDDLALAEIAAGRSTLDHAGKISPHACAIHRVGIVVHELPRHVVAEKLRAIRAVHAIAKAQRVALHLDKVEVSENIFEIDDIETGSRR